MIDSLRSLVAGVALAFAVTLAATASTQAADAASFNDTARYLGGLPVAAGSPLEAKTRTPFWQSHAATLDQSWARLERQQISRVRAWSKATLPAAQPVALYMFSGPDFLYADAVLPDHATYVMAGLEPVGPIPRLDDASPQALASGLASLRSSIASVLTLSFFITKRMKTEFRATPIKGTLPPLLLFLVRSGKTVEDVALVSVNAEGEVVPATGAVDSTGGANGVRITFKSGDGPSRTLYYFQTDVSDGGLKRTGFAQFIEKLGPADSYVKSASFLMHMGAFSGIRDLLLKQSRVIVQDDSGIPLKFFKESDWELKPFGRYLGPISIFRQHTQRDLGQLFTRANAPRIDFGVGYRYRPNESNLLVAIKKAQ